MAITLVVLQNPLIQKEIDSDWANFINWILVIATLYTYYVSIWSPYGEWLKIRKQNWQELTLSAKKIRATYLKKYDLAINIMIPYPEMFYWIEPTKKDTNKRKFTLYGKVFKMVWSSGNYNVKKGFRITTNQGACGHAYTEQEITIVDSQTQQSFPFNFTQKQLNATSNLKILISYPMIVKIDEAFEQKTKVVGVLNVESKTPDANNLLTNKIERDQLFKNIANLAAIYIKWYFIK